MVAEIISVGTELLLGSTVDTDSAYLGRTLAAGTPAEIRVHKEVVSAYLGG